MLSFRVTWRTHIACVIISSFMALICMDILNNMFDTIIYSGILKYPTGSMVINYILLITAAALAISVVHELVHGLFYSIFGGEVRFGFKGIYAYTREISGKPIKRIEFLIILLSPLFVISLLSICFLDFGRMLFVINLLGSSGDMYMALTLIKYKRGSRIVDRSYGFDILSFEDEKAVP